MWKCKSPQARSMAFGGFLGRDVDLSALLFPEAGDGLCLSGLIPGAAKRGRGEGVRARNTSHTQNLLGWSEQKMRRPQDSASRA